MSNVSAPKYVIPLRSRLRHAAVVIGVYGTSAAIVLGPVLWWLCK